jgi:hypothetical protein
VIQRPPPALACDPVLQAGNWTHLYIKDRLSRRWAESRFTNLVHFNEPEHGGHFAAVEQPLTFIDDVRRTFAGLRGASSA